MAPKQAAGRVTKPAVTATGRKSRKGRPKAYALEQVPVDSYDFFQTAQNQDHDPTGNDAASQQKPAAEQMESIIPSIEKEDDAAPPLLPASNLGIPEVVSEKKTHLPTLDQSPLNMLEKPANIKTSNSQAVSPPPPPPATPDAQIHETVESSSELSSVPSSLGSTPEGFVSRNKRRIVPHQHDGSPPRRSERARKRSAKLPKNDEPEPAKKRQRLTKVGQIDIVPSIEGQTILNRRHSKALGSESDDDSPSASSEAGVASTTSDEGYATRTPEAGQDITQKPSKGLTLDKRKTKAEARFYSKLEEEIYGYDPETGHVPKSEIWTKFDPKKVIMYGSDATTQYTPAFAAEPPRRGGKTNGRGAARGGRGGAGNGRGRGGKHRGRGRDEDSPEPPQPRRSQTQEEALLVKHVKARQAELRKFFGVVAGSQTEILDLLASRDVTRLAKKPKAHKQVVEYDELVDCLEEMRNEVQDMARAQYQTNVEAENTRFEAEKAALESTLKAKIKDMHDEYRRGAQGDLIIFRRAIAAAQDETRTQDGSEVDYFPQYHELPEANETIRGYSSARFTDEKPFKHHLLTYDDQARREVIDDDVAPIIEAFARKNAERRAAEELQRSQTMEALSEEAEKQLREMRGYLIPRPMSRQDDINSFALSCLADVSEWMAQRYPNKQYIYMPLEDGDTLPREILNYDRLPGRGVKVPQPPVPPSYSEPLTPRQGSVATRQSSIAPAQGTRRSLRNLQPNGPVIQAQPQAPQPQLQQPSTPASAPAPPTPAAATSAGPALAPAPPRLPSAHSVHGTHPRPPPIDTRVHVPSPPERSPVQSLQHQSQASPAHGPPSMQPRNTSGAMTPKPSPYAFSQQPFSPAQSSPRYPQHRPVPPPLQYPAGQSTHYNQPHKPMPSPYAQPLPMPFPGYGPPQFYHQQPPPPSTQQPQQHNYVFVPPQQAAGPPQIQGDLNPQSYARGSIPPLVPPPQGQQLPPHQEQFFMNQNVFHNQNRMPGLPYPLQAPTMGQQAPPLSTPQPSAPPRPMNNTKSRSRAKTKNSSVTFVNQTLATRKAAAEQLAKEEAAAAAEKRDREREKERAKASLTASGTNTNVNTNENGSGAGNGNNANNGAGSNANGRKLAPKN